MMKTISYIGCLTGLLGFAAAATAQQLVFDFPVDPVDASIPDGNPNGVSFTGHVSGAPTTLSTNSFSVALDFAGDFIGGNGDLYVSLRSPMQNGDPSTTKLAVLLNRPGVTGDRSAGYQDNGMDVVLYDGADDPNHKTSTGSAVAFGDIHFYQDDKVFGGIGGNDQPITGIYKSDGRNIDPLGLGAAIAAHERDASLRVFEGINPNGDWTLFVADMVAQNSLKLNSWGLDFTPIPEPQEWAMAIGMGLLGFALYRRQALKVA